MWADYPIDGALSKGCVGTGISAQSSIKLKQSGDAMWNARVAYHLDDTWTVALTGNNLFDKSNYNTVGTASWGNFYSEPYNFTVSFKGNF